MARTWGAIEGVINTLTWCGTFAGAGALALMGALITFEVLGRFLFGYSTLFADEMSGYLLVLLLFAGLAHTLRTGGFLRVEFLFNRLPKRVQIWVELTASIISLFYMAVLSYEAWLMVYDAYDFAFTSVRPSGILLWIPQACLPLGCSLLVLEFLAHIGRLIRDLFGQEP